jgi:hypothetical protein
MTAEPLYRQCLLKRGESQQTSWLPEKFAQVGQLLKLKSDAGEWEEGWVVAEARIGLLPWSKILDHRKLGGFGSLSGN